MTPPAGRPPASPAVLVTGASTGVGRACALHLDSREFRVFAAVRRDEDADALRGAASSRLTPLLMDVTDAEAISSAAATVGAAAGDAGLQGLVNNAGIALGDPLEFVRLDDVRRVLEVNLVGAIAVTQAFLPLLRRGHGRVVCIGSIGGRFPAPFTGAYGASKAALAAICDSLRVELRPWRIDVVLIEPGSVSTPIWEKGLREFDSRMPDYPPAALELYGRAIGPVRSMTEKLAAAGIPPLSVARVVEQALRARRPRTRYLVGRDARVQALLRHLPDRARDRLMASFMRLPKEA
ncbi:MAG: SDR family NAD(P)-dependent oxidoreductase [Chloroflexi bacterium]|nr:MAG: SDR family NAD(P)-dependent oxidoreductase [Chloroflexota bacterium]